ncbi:MAG TPA: hypothetical protein EYQ27_15135 [Gemmatimonadetes bacterium]|nr:hypothetical protein [Gemmatimonadota bacterium]
MTTTDSKSKALVTRGNSGFAIVDDSTAKEIMLSAFEQLGLSNFQLNRIKIPSGGMTSWEVESLEGSSIEKHLDVIIVSMVGKQKSWWAVPIDQGGVGSPPSCSSTDGRTGVGNNTLDPDAASGTHKCVECTWNQFGSSRGQGEGKDCSDTTLLFFFPKGGRIPSLLVVPATSLKSLQNYVLRLIDAGKRMETCVTRLALKKAASRSGISYSQLDISWVADLGEEEAGNMVEVAREFREKSREFDPHKQEEGGDGPPF